MIRKFINKLLNSNKEKETKEGTVKFFNYSKGFGFISVKDTDEEIFVHTTNIIDKIKEKDQVTFNVEEGEKGLNAVNVRVI